MYKQLEFIMKGDFLLLASDFGREKEASVDENEYVYGGTAPKFCMFHRG